MIEETLGIGEQFLSNFQDIITYLKTHAGQLLWDLLATVVIFFIARLALYLVSRITRNVMDNPKYHTTERQGKRIDTIMTLVRSVARYVIYFIAILQMLAQFGFGSTMQNLLVTAGIGSLAIGFGAQNLVRDVVTGLFMMFENQFSVGDYIKTDEAEGTVEAAAMRVTYLRSLKGDQIIVPNGSISRVVNYTRGGSVAKIIISTAYEADTRRVIGIIGEAVEKYAQENGQLIEEAPFVQGITNFGESSVDIGVVCKAKPMKQWEVERGMRLAVKEQFDAMGVEFPYPHMVTIAAGPAGSMPADGTVQGSRGVPKELENWENSGDDENG